MKVRRWAPFPEDLFPSLSIRRALRNANENIWSTDRFQAVKDRRIGPIGECVGNVGKVGDIQPGVVDKVRTELRHKRVGGGGSRRGNRDVRWTQHNRNDGVRWGRSCGGGSYVDLAEEPVNVALIIEIGGEIYRRNRKRNSARTNVLGARATIKIAGKRKICAGVDIDGMKVRGCVDRKGVCRPG